MSAVGIGLGAAKDLLLALAAVSTSPAVQEAAKQWLVERAGIPQDKLDALIASEHAEPDPKK